MALSTRTLMKERAWVKVIRGLAEGVNSLPLKMEYMGYNALKVACVRENARKTGYTYLPSIRKGKVTVIKSRSHAEPFGEQLQSEQALQ